MSSLSGVRERVAGVFAHIPPVHKSHQARKEIEKGVGRKGHGAGAGLINTPLVRHLLSRRRQGFDFEHHFYNRFLVLDGSSYNRAPLAKLDRRRL